MPEKVMPGPVSDSSGVREAVCVHTKKIMDACRDKDCVEDLRVYPTQAALENLSRCTSVKGGRAELLHVTTSVEPISFNRGFYTVDVRYFYRITADAFVGAPRPAAVEGLCVFDKRVILFGSEGSSKTFRSDDPFAPATANQPVAVVEAVDPLVLSLKAMDVGAGVREGELLEVPQAIGQVFDSPLCLDTQAGVRLYVTLGQFSLIRLERDTQLLIPAYDYCLPEKECPGEAPAQDPCDIFRHVQFPVSEFFPTDRTGGGDCSCC